jgi:uncharacterized protein
MAEQGVSPVGACLFPLAIGAESAKVVTMPTDHIRYDLLVQEALRSVVRKVLSDAARDGLKGEHHFYVSFRTGAPGVRLSNRLREQYPEEMTIVLQHQFWDLGITDHTFEVGLSFGGVPERLLIPYEAIVGFFDPSVQFGLKFEVQDDATAGNDDRPAPKPLAPVAQLQPPKPAGGVLAVSPPPKKTARGAASEPEDLPPKKSGGKAAKAEAEAPAATPADPSGAEVLSLDAFRKKK